LTNVSRCCFIFSPTIKYTIACTGIHQLPARNKYGLIVGGGGAVEMVVGLNIHWAVHLSTYRHTGFGVVVLVVR
jgi:hypothetical protein